MECPKKYRGDLVALKRHEEDIFGHPFFLYWLFSPAGKNLGLAGGGELDQELDSVRDGSCDEPEAQLPSRAPSRPKRPSLENAIRMEGSLMARRLTTHIEPTYPTQALSQHIQGNGVLQVRVAADGTVHDVNLVSGPPQLVEAAKTAVRQWKYRPVISSGHPVAALTIVNVPFRLP
jgi:TonB family protein